MAKKYTSAQLAQKAIEIANYDCSIMCNFLVKNNLFINSDEIREILLANIKPYIPFINTKFSGYDFLSLHSLLFIDNYTIFQIQSLFYTIYDDVVEKKFYEEIISYILTTLQTKYGYELVDRLFKNYDGKDFFTGKVGVEKFSFYLSKIIKDKLGYIQGLKLDTFRKISYNTFSNKDIDYFSKLYLDKTFSNKVNKQNLIYYIENVHKDKYSEEISTYSTKQLLTYLSLIGDEIEEKFDILQITELILSVYSQTKQYFELVNENFSYYLSMSVLPLENQYDKLKHSRKVLEKIRDDLTKQFRIKSYNNNLALIRRKEMLKGKTEALKEEFFSIEEELKRKKIKFDNLELKIDECVLKTKKINLEIYEIERLNERLIEQTNKLKIHDKKDNIPYATIFFTISIIIFILISIIILLRVR